MPYNIIIVVFDTLRYDAVFGDLADTPNLSRFAQQAAVFDSAWGEGLPTIPFRRALYTGMRSYPWTHSMAERGVYPHVRGWHAIPDHQTTLAEHLSAHGYATQLVSDVYHMFKPTMNFTRGFVAWDAVRGQEIDTYELAGPSLEAPSELDGQRVGPAGYLYQVRNRASESDYFVAKLFDRASDLVVHIGGAAPYCLWVESFSPHEFWDPPLSYADRYAERTGAEYIVPQTLNKKEPTTAEIERTKALYRGYVTFCDERFGRFVDTLETSGALDDSIVVVLSDHGTELWDKGRFGKSYDRLHPYNTHINLMIRHPEGVGRGTHVDAFVQNQDIAPTLLSMVGIGHPRMDGEDIWPLVTGSATVPRRDVIVTGWETYASVRTKRWSLMLDTADPNRCCELYDTEDDPGESLDVSGENQVVVADLVGSLEQLLGGPLPANYRHQPLAGPDATVGDLRRRRTLDRGVGGRWVGSNVE